MPVEFFLSCDFAKNYNSYFKELVYTEESSLAHRTCLESEVKKVQDISMQSWYTSQKISYYARLSYQGTRRT